MNNNRPSHVAYVVTDVKTGNGGETKSIWREVGVVWSHRNGEGFDLVVHPQMSVSGRIVCVPPKSDRD